MTGTTSATSARPISFKLERWQRRSIYACGLGLLLSGAAWLVLHFFLRPVSQFGESINPLEPWTMKFHGAAAMAALFLICSVLHLHIRRAIRAGRNLVTGWVLIAMLSFMIVTSYGLYYVAGESDRPLWSLLHWVVGCTAALVFMAHILVGRRSVRA